VPVLPGEARGFDERAAREIPPLLADMLRASQASRHVSWLYTPMALPLAASLDPQAIVYDCMDELSAFMGAPPALREREAELFACADVVFTGGPSLYRAKRDKHPNVHCFASSVDAAHFRRALAIPEAPALAHVPYPRLGFYGVLDERLDRDLLEAAAALRPEWQFVLVGPVVKIADSDLPRRANLHYLGQRSYDELPAFLAGWDVCLLPFARNESTRFISPTKVLEYMAAEKPIVSTPITDVAEPYADVVRLAATPAELIAACEGALQEAGDERARRTQRMRDILARTSWDATVEHMARLVDAVSRPSKGRDTWQLRRPSSSAPAPRA
jgi:UDP-galactopyranose mutase